MDGFGNSCESSLNFSFKWPCIMPCFSETCTCSWSPALIHTWKLHYKASLILCILSVLSPIGVALLGTCWGDFKINNRGKKFSIRRKIVSREPAGSLHKTLKGDNSAVLNNEGQVLLVPGSLWQGVNDKFHYCECQFKGWWENLL